MTHTDFNQLLSSLKGLTPAQVRQLRQQLDKHHAQPKKPTRPVSAKRAKPAAPHTSKKPMTRDEFNRRLLAEGRLASLPNPALDLDDDDPDDQPITIEGEPLSETIIRERR
jgi:hypothetical protein